MKNIDTYWRARRDFILFLCQIIGYSLVLLVFLVTRGSLVSLITQGATFNPISQVRRYNLVPFQTVLECLQLFGLRGPQLVGNVLIFVPLGIAFRCFFPNHKLVVPFLMTAGTSLAVELLQFALATGCLDVDDLLLNSLGGLLGVLLYQLLYLLCKRNYPKTNALVTTLGLIFPPFLLSYIRFFVMPGIAGLRFGLFDALLLLVYFGCLILLLRKAPKWQLLVQGVGCFLFSFFFYGFFIHYV